MKPAAARSGRARSPEVEFLLMLARGDVEAARELADRPLDWRRISTLAVEHEAAPLCHWFLDSRSRAAPHGDLPPSAAAFTQTLRDSYLHHSLKNEALQSDIATLREELLARGVEALYLKGPWLAWHAYPDPGTRPIGDIDLLIKERDYGPALEAIAQLGYSAHPAPPPSSHVALLQAHYGQQLRFHCPGRRTLELHFRLVNLGPPAAEEAWVWDTRRQAACGDSPIDVAGPEAMLLHLLLHTNQHGFAILRLLLDIRWALERDGTALNWASLLAQIDALKCRASAYHGLTLARTLAGAAPPGPVLDALAPSRARAALYSRCWRLGDVGRLTVGKRATPFEAPLFYLFELGSWRDKWRYVRGMISRRGGIGSFGRDFVDKMRSSRRDRSVADERRTP